MNKQTRRNFFTACAAGFATLLVGANTIKPRTIKNCELHLDGQKPMDLVRSGYRIPLEWDDLANEWVISSNARNIYIGKSIYRIRRVDTLDRGVKVSTWDEYLKTYDMTCPIAGRDLQTLIKFELSVQCNSDEMGYHNRYIIINNKNEYGFLASKYPCWNFRKYSE